ncbi:L-type lectin-domain containing receptor kinase IX.1-like [Papaver somniferum]|uniref:L-type lectin-domain containing receptor kinase IX.1-like n=1 Tax=Papaver somniferum TaxID=3469 RepID=UPI000E6F6DF5|nr:L-type lectin-domain containing receptor kinase IX.1-like [Papaver somniferum]
MAFSIAIDSGLRSSIFFFLIFKTLLILPITADSISFNFPNFTPPVSEINFQNDSHFGNDNGAIELTKNSADDNLSWSVGWATYSEPIQLWDATTGRLTDFETHFSFIIKSLDETFFGDGVTFFLAPFGRKVPPESSGGRLGLMSRGVVETNMTTNRFVAVEFDTWRNDLWDHPSPDHVGIDINSVVSVANVSWNSSLKDGRTANAWVSYNSTTHNLSVFLTYADNPVFDGDSILHYITDLTKVLAEKVMVGFSASTGVGYETHKLLSWEFNSNLENDEARIEITNKGKDRSVGLVVGLVVGFVILGVGLGFALLIWWKKRGGSSRNIHPETENSDMDNEFVKGTGPKRFSYNELVRATSNFDEEGKLGEGGFGGVYKGCLREKNLKIAVKRVSRGSKQGKKEYQSEVRIISQLRHRNLVQLIGWCHERDELLLVYEFMPNRSLDKHLFRGESILTWEIRYKVALGLASALLYQHEEWEQCVVHRDIKSSNVMLDSNFNAKLGDFGLARLVDHDLGSQTTVLAGTMGYLAPECIMTLKSSKESDVYSFGIVALEIACGRKPDEVALGLSLVEWVWGLYGRGKIMKASDERLAMDFNELEMEHLIIVGFWCAHPDSKSRPSATQVLNVLKFESPLPKLPREIPTPIYLPTGTIMPLLQSFAGLTDTLTAR